jgi:ATP-dependent 26S proteasome regulatory subunit
VITDTSPSEVARSLGWDLLPVLQWLDGILADAVARAREVYSPDDPSDRFRGLYISDADVDRMLDRAPAAPLLWTGPQPESGGCARLEWLADTFSLDALDRGALVLALAPEVDLRYERLYAYLQDDVTRRRPSVDLALSLFCATREDRLAGIGHFQSSGALMQNRLVELVPEAGAQRPSLLANGLVVDEQIARFLLGYEAIDRRLVSHARLLESDPSDRAADSRWVRLGRWIRSSKAAGEVRLYFHGFPGSGRLEAALEVAGGAGKSLLVVEGDSLPSDDDAAGALLRVAVREAWLQDAVLYLDGADHLAGGEHRAAATRLHAILDAGGAPVILAGQQSWPPGMAGISRVVPIRFEAPARDQRTRLWSEALTGDLPADPSAPAEVALRFRFGRHQVENTVAAAVVQAVVRDSTRKGLSSADLLAAARQQTGHVLDQLATRVTPSHRWDDLVLPEASMRQLRELCDRVIHREQVLDRWGFGTSLSRGKGVNALFSGASGTGKTMGAEIIAGELGLDLFKVRLAGVVSKYIGETERNLDRVFEAAERTDGIVLFDEADALFGKRSEVHDSHDRYANLEISYLLQRMEEYDGIAILSTNLRGNLDHAFVRRLTFNILFPLPDESDRRAIWTRVWPADAPLSPDVDVDLLAARFTLTGGNIRNIALAAAFLAAADGGLVTMRHVLQGVRREYEKLGKTLSEADLTGPGADP